MTPLELEEMTRELRESRPVMDPKTSAELDEWAASGFARPEGSTDERGAGFRARPPRRRRWLVPAFGAVAAATLMAGVVISLQPETTDDSPISRSGDDAAEVESTDGNLNAAPLSVEPASPPDRIQDESAGLSLLTEDDQVGDVTDDVAAIVQSYDGIVDELSVRSGGDREARGFIQARIPVQSFNAALAEISDLATVEARNQGLTDITKSYVSAEKRFANAQARVETLLEQLAANPGDPVLEEQLRIARRELVAARAGLRAQKQDGNFAKLTLSVAGEDGGWSLGDAADDAVGVLEWIGGALLVTLAVLVPAAAIGAALWFGSRSVRRRRRESVLDE
jgi:hypothetical protein